MSRISPWWVCCALALAAATRLPYLTRRPVHADEAVHAAKLGQYLQTGTYTYDPNDYHGPTLNYLSAIVAKLCGQRSFAQLDEITIRLVPVIFGLALVLLPLGIADGLGPWATVGTMLFTAVSPAFAFYSRYFLHEPILVSLSMGLLVCVYRYAVRPAAVWPVLAGLLAGLIIATKETSIIVFVSMLAAAVLCRPCRAIPGRPLARDLALGLAAAALVGALCMSSFLANPRGIWEGIAAVKCYIDRAETGPHVHPWHYYLDLLTWIPLIERPTWNEDFVVFVGLAGLVLPFAVRQEKTDPALARFIAVYTATMLVSYCLVPYKTPWCMLGFLHGMILAAAILVQQVYLRIGQKGAIWLGAVAVLGVAVPLAQAQAMCIRFHSDPSNPYVYAHTTEDVPALARAIDMVAWGSGVGRDLYIQVICPEDDYWPIPWYLRVYQNVGYWSSVDPNYPPGQVIIASPSVEVEVADLIYQGGPGGPPRLYTYLMDPPVWLRHGFEVRAYVRRDLYEAAMQDRRATVYDLDPNATKD